jgi:hypothetical protein
VIEIDSNGTHSDARESNGTHSEQDGIESFVNSDNIDSKEKLGNAKFMFTVVFRLL